MNQNIPVYAQVPGRKKERWHIGYADGRPDPMNFSVWGIDPATVLSIGKGRMGGAIVWVVVLAERPVKKENESANFIGLIEMREKLVKRLLAAHSHLSHERSIHIITSHIGLTDLQQIVEQQERN